jgi:hypothetical protein
VFSLSSFAQISKQLAAQRTNANFKIDGSLDEAAWKTVTPATDFIEWRPNAGKHEEAANRTEVYILYDNTSIYVGGYCHERTKDSISKELVGRDMVGVNDFVGVIFDTYHDKINAFGFYVTALGEQFDAKYSNTAGEDDSWNAVWNSETKIHEDGWSFEMRIPYSALRFSSGANQTWGLNFIRRRSKTGQQYAWSPIDPKINGFINQEGTWTGIEKIETPLRLSLSPYFSAYANHYPNHNPNKKDLTSSVTGGMDVKYGINDAFTLDMTLIPDFGQVRSDNQVLNLSPFEVRYTENRPFFTEGTELFNKGNLFYSRRIGSTPIHYGDVDGWMNPGDSITKNPTETKLINATKISGRTKKGLGIGFFNAITKPAYANVQNLSTKEFREVEISPWTNYNIFVLDQTLKNNSSVSFINTNVLRSGADYDANVSAAMFDFNNKKNTYNWNGKFAISHLTKGIDSKEQTGYSHNLGFGKTGGRWNFNISQEIANTGYDINDMGILYNNNYVDHSLWTGYRWLKPGKWFNRAQINFNANYSRLYQNFEEQRINSKFQSFNTNINANAQLKNLWSVGFLIGYLPEGNDFYEPRNEGWSFRTTERMQYNAWFETNSAKKYFFYFSFFTGQRKQFRSRNYEFNVTNRYRFSDKFSISHDLYLNPFSNDAGFYKTFFQKDASDNYILDAKGNRIVDNIIFSRRDRMTVENVLNFKYSFNNKSGITLRARHYWSKVEQLGYYDLQTDGTLQETARTDIETHHRNTNIFNVDAVYTWQFAPGSFVNIVWKDQSFTDDDNVRLQYFKNARNTFAASQANNLSIKILYYLDYLDFKKWKKKKD